MNLNKERIGKNFGKLVVFFLVFTLMFSTIALATDFFTIYDITETEKLSEGITYEHIEKLSSKGWININVVRANLDNKYTSVKPIYSNDGISNRDNLSDLLNDSKAIAGINGDFFYTSYKSFPMGTLIDDGVVISSPNTPSYEYPTITRSNDGDIDISIWEPNIYLETKNKDTFYVAAVNKTGAFKGEIIVLNKSWGKKSIGSTSDRQLVEIVVDKNKVKDIRINKPATSIPSKGYVIICSISRKDELLSAFKKGTQVDLNFEFDFELKDIDWAAGGVNYLVKDGEFYKSNTSISGRHPRTAIGFNEDKTEMILVTIDGRNKDYTGVTQEELANIMMELGSYEAVNMDGGGSTTMGVDFLRNGKASVVNFPSDGKERIIDSGLGVFDTSPTSRSIKYIEVIPDRTKVFKNSYVSFDVKAYDKNYNVIKTYDKYIKIKTVGTNGKISGNKFKPYNTGKVKVQVTYKNIKEYVEIDVLDEAVELVFNDDSLILDTEETYDLGNIIGIDKDGNSACVSTDDIKWSYRNSIGRVKDGILTAGSSSNSGAITASYGKAIKSIFVKVGYKAVTIEDFEDFNNLSFSVYPYGSRGSIEKSTKDKQGNYSLKLNYDFTNMTDQSIAFVNMDTDGYVIDGKPKAIGMWVYGDAKDHWLRCRITDNTGTLYKIDFAKEVDWTGWKWVTAKIPESAVYPIKLKNLYIAEIYESMKDTGSIYLDNLRALYEPDDKEISVPEDTHFIDSMKANSEIDYNYMVNITNGVLTNDTINEDISVLSIDISKGGISSTNIYQWKEFEVLSKYKDKKIIINLNGSLNMFNDKKELTVFQNRLNEIASNNDIFVIWQGTTNYFSLINNIRYLEYLNDFNLYITDDEMYYN